MILKFNIISLIILAEECCAPFDPVCGVEVGLDVETGDVVGGVSGRGHLASTFLRFVDRAVETTRVAVFHFQHRLKS